ncbi:hypothetical protein Dpo_1c04210 [Desulfotignum phosphitoxidans DSM 13687]|uniref:Uncharacterized protein n=1 Tax=Desulfotignum phosphitoxidans DSM 13687 TaxID=1286635 RepID=S0G328_9BACT|nr:hypothetical protein Dpo_1c04210 [Desulfotignum phosphitoxidans DSM 13687]
MNPEFAAFIRFASMAPVLSQTATITTKPIEISFNNMF